MKLKLLISLLLFTFCRGVTQNGMPVLSGARGMALGQAVVPLADVNSLFNNQAGLATIKSLTATVTGEQRFGLDDIRSFAAGAGLPTRSGTFGLSLQYYGFEAYSEQKIGLAYARQLSSLFSLGGQFVVLHTRIPEYGSLTRLTFELGFRAELLPELTLGAHVYSPLRVEVTDGEYLPSLLRVGAAYQPSAGLILTMEVEKDVDFPARFKGGVEYRIIEPLTLRMGMATAPGIYSFGVGYLLNPHLTLDFGSYYHQQLGLTPAISVSYQK